MEDTVTLARQEREKQGPWEAEVSYGGEADLHRHLAGCDKNPGHQKFVPVDQFNVDHLPSGCQDNDLVDLVRAVSDLTVRVSVKYVSACRPKTDPGSGKPYPCYKNRGSNMMTVGTGWVYKVDKHLDEEDKHLDEEDKYPDEEDTYLDEEDKHLDEEDKYPDEEDKYLDEEDKHLDGENKYPDEEDKYLDEEDKHLDGENKYPDKEDTYLNEEDKHLDEEDKYPDEEDKYLDEEDKHLDGENKHLDGENKYPDEENKYPDEEDKYPDKENNRYKTCPCQECQISPTPKTQFAHIYISTAAHVVYDSLEAAHTTCHLFFDKGGTPEACSGVVTLRGGSAGNSYVDHDWSWMTFVTHDLDLADRLNKMMDHVDTLRERLNEKLARLEAEKQKSSSPAEDLTNASDDLAIIVSHPHGCSKQISVGYCVDRVKSMGRMCPRTYTTSTCPGSSGAKVLSVKFGWGEGNYWSDGLVHTGNCEGNKNVNYCSDYLLRPIN